MTGERSWDVFQRDVLDVLRQYQGYFDFFERVGSLSDTRPDCFARVTRENKKEIWIVDAKNKDEIDADDVKRMEKYVSMVKSNPVDVGLELSELAEHDIRGIFVTAPGASINGHEQVDYPQLHQFLQKELVYTDTEKVVRDVAKMVEKKQLSHSQARLLFNSVKPFEQRVNRGVEKLEALDREFVGLELEKPPINSYDYNIPVDVVLKHNSRDEMFLFDIPYSEDAVEEIEDKVREIRERIADIDRPVYYTVINTFQQRDSGYLLQPDQIRREVMETAGIVSPEEVIDLFTPKIPVEKEYGDDYVEVRDRADIGLQARVKTSDDVNHSIEVALPEEAVSKVKDQFLNTREIGEIQGNRFREDIEVTPELEVIHSQGTEPLESFKKAVRSVYQSSVNPVLSRKVSGAI